MPQVFGGKSKAVKLGVENNGNIVILIFPHSSLFLDRFPIKINVR